MQAKNSAFSSKILHVSIYMFAIFTWLNEPIRICDGAWEPEKIEHPHLYGRVPQEWMEFNPKGKS